ncbi:MAG TPA: DUF4386 family protein [Gemmatimonadaceae bacterium]
MKSAKSAGRIIGLALLVQVVLAPPVYFRWLRPVTAPGFLENAAGSAMQIRIALLLTFVLSAMTFIAAIAALPVFRRYSERMAFAFLALSAVGLSTLAMESVATRNLLSLSLEVVKTGVATEQLQILGSLARTTRAGVHFTNLVVAHGTVCFLYIVLFRFSLVPRALAGSGMAAALLSTTAVTLPLLGYRFDFLLIVPVALCDLALILWLMARGLEERKRFPHAAATSIA